MRLHDHYDWVVLGHHPAALLNACLVAKAGLSVLVLPLGKLASFQNSPSGQPYDPEPNFLLGLGEGGYLWKCLNRIGVEPVEIEKLTREVLPQILTPSYRLSLKGPTELSAEIQRELGKSFLKRLNLSPLLKQSKKELESFWGSEPLFENAESTQKEKEFSARLKLFRKSLKKSSQASVLGSDQSIRTVLSESSDFQEVATGVGWLLGEAQFSAPSFFDLLQLYYLSQESRAFEGGMSAYRQFLLEQGKKLGVHFSLKTHCRRIFIERGKFVGIQVATRGNMISAQGALMGCSLKSASRQMVQTEHVWFKRKMKISEPCGWRFTLALSIRREAIPVEMASRVIWQEKDAPPLEMEQTESFLPHFKTFYLRTVLPYSEESLTLEFQKQRAIRMVSQLQKLIPFVEFHIGEIFPDFRRLRTESLLINDARHDGGDLHEQTLTEWRDLFGFQTLDEIPDNLLVYPAEKTSKSQVEGLFLASSESDSQLGSLGPVIAAVEGAQWITRRLGVPFGSEA